MPATTHDDVATERRGEVALWAGLALCMAVGPLMLYTLTAVSPLIIEDLGLSPAQYGAIAAITFISAALGALLLAAPSSRYGARAVMVAVSIGAGAGLALLAVADSYPVILAAALVSGLAQALSNPATNRIVAGLPADRRGALIGWKQSGVQMAQLAAGLAAPAIALLVGWRWAAVAGLLVAVAGVVSALRIRPHAPAPADGAGSAERPQASVSTLTAYTFFMGFGLQATNAYLPLFAHRRLAFDIGTAGLTAAVVGCVGLASRIWWARTSDRVGLRSTTLLTLAAGSALGVVLCVLAMWLGGWLVWLGAGVFGAAALASNAVTMVALVRSVPAASLGSATGLLVTGMYAGFATGPLGFGLVLDHGAGFGIAWLLPLCAFGVAALIGLRSALTRPVRIS
ncbi:putative MFS family arabinose efflux permease [Nocardioides albertanoniae]|uniref:Putative MFS family arabinose efflux permease n=1 Tax=Nocardioides albertanoniae TaxID=1175486 RepID=A0A543A2Z2_9ACTN|nr:MFS transporter [Nocardioides albertanoniae]TQL66955.1 putative MFS family arabinose efflux permease [Nocardioides albertanoniae]